MTHAVIVHFTEIAGSEKPDTFGKAGLGSVRRIILSRDARCAVVRYPDYLSELTVSFLRP